MSPNPGLMMSFIAWISFCVALLSPFRSLATNHLLRQEELMAGLNGDPTVQYLQITVGGGDQKAWGPNGAPASRAMLVFFNGAGVETGRFFFPSNAPVGANTVLIATTNFAALPGAPAPDFLIPPLISPGSGKVCFRGNPANPLAFDVNLCLSYGSFPSSQTEGAGPPAPALPITGEPASLERFQNFSLGQPTSRNEDFRLSSPSPQNTRGETLVFPVDGPEIDLRPAVLDFGQANINAGATGLQTIVITNRGVVNPLIITNVTLTGTNANQFRLRSDTGQTILPPGGTRAVAFEFDPDTAGTKTAVMRVISNDPDEVVSDAILRGVGVDPNAPEVFISPTTLNFGKQDIMAGSSASQTVGIVNQGSVGSLVVSNITLTGVHANQFQLLSPTNSSTIPPGGSRVVTVAFDPDSAGPKTALLRIVSNDTDEGQFDVSLQGRAFDLNPCLAPNPTNIVAQNACGNAQFACPGFVYRDTTFGASVDGSAGCVVQRPDVWYRYLPASDGTLTVTARAISFNTPLSLSAHLGCPGSTGGELACAVSGPIIIPPPPGGTLEATASITFAVTNRREVFLRVSAVASLASVFELTLEGPPCVEFDGNRNGITDSCELDFGDAPAPYPTTLAANGARHRAFTGIFLGKRIDPNLDGMPSASAAGDNLDGLPNDEEGVTLLSPLTVGAAAAIEVFASAQGFLSGWIDFNADGDWADAGEQVFAGQVLASGANLLGLNVPSGATVTNRTFARFRFSTGVGLSFLGESLNGEVEDYAVEIVPATSTPGDLQVRINEVMAGLNGDSAIQFVEIEVNGDSHKGWGPQGAETAGRAMLVFFDETGAQSGRFVFPSNAPAGGDSVLIATRAFAEATGLTPDFLMPPEVMPVAGQVLFRGNPDNEHFNTHIALSYGGNAYLGFTDGAGPPNTNQLPIMHARSLTRMDEVAFGLNDNRPFRLVAPTPRNTAGQTFSFAPASIREQGRTLFSRETFRGNGRTCATCHVEGKDQFGLTPATIAALPADDPLFVFAPNVNTLRLTTRSGPGDLRGEVNAGGARAKILGGSGDTYLVIGGTNLAGAITDENGNSGVVQSVAVGDLNGPTASNGSQRGLEDHELLEHGRGLILENIDGFDRGEVFRASPHLLDLAFTAPFGLSGEFDNLDDFSDGAVVQHFPRSLARVSGVDFRHPTREELEAMTAFMMEISRPSTNALNLDRLATTEAQKRGRAMFFGDEGRCSKCHSGPVLAFSDGSLSGSLKDFNDNFDTGVANLPVNLPDTDDLPTEPAGLVPGQSTREFNTPSLFNIRLTAPFFHDGSAATLADAVKFYDTEEFHNSPAGQEVGSLLAANKAEKIADMVAFLESLVELPVDFTRELSFGIRCPGDPPPGALVATVTNIGTNTITLTNVFINGTNAMDFSITSDSGETTLAPGQTRSIAVSFAPATMGIKTATLEVGAFDTNLLGAFAFGVALSGADIDNIVQATPGAFDFGTRDIDAPPSPEDSVVITNDGSTDLPIVVEFTGATNDFVVIADASPIPANGARVMQISFAPKTQGVKSAMIRIHIVSCSGTLMEIPLAGIATSTVFEFGWDFVGATQFVGTPFPVRITARDRNGDTVESFRGAVRFESIVQTPAPETGTIPITPTNSTPFVNGVWTGSLAVHAAASSMRVSCVDSRGHLGRSAPFSVLLRDDLSIAVAARPAPDGDPISYMLSVHNTGPIESTGVVVSNQLPTQLRFISGDASQGAVSHSGGLVTCTLGTLAPGATAQINLFADALPPTNSLSITNIAVVSRTEAEAVLTNNVAVAVTLLNPFSILAVTPATNFHRSGFSSGPFTPTTQFYTVSNAGTAVLTWQALLAGCQMPPGFIASWPLDGNAGDVIGTNVGVLFGNPVFTNALVGSALLFDGVDDAVRVNRSPALDVGAADGLTMEAWINPADVSQQRPVIEYANDNVTTIGPHLWISVPSGGLGGPGCVFANVSDQAGASHHIISGPNLVVPNAWQHIALTYSKTTGVGTLYLNGEIVAQQNLGIFTPRTTPDLFIGRRPALASFVGMIDEVGIANRDLAREEIRAIFNSGPSGKCISRGSSGLACASPQHQVAWWSLDGNTLDVLGTNVGVLSGNAVFTNGLVGSALAFDGSGDRLRLAASPALNVGGGEGLTVESWVRVPTVSRPSPLFEWSDLSSPGPHLWLSSAPAGSLFANLVDANNVSHPISSPGSLLTANTWHHVALSYDKFSGLATLYIDGVFVQRQNVGIFTPKTGTDLFIGHRPTGSLDSFLGLIDEPAVYRRALSDAEVQSIFNAGAAGKCGNSSAPVNCLLPLGLTSWWPFDGTLVDAVDGNTGFLFGSPVVTNGFVGQAMFFSGNNDAVRVPVSSSLDFGSKEGMTFEAWVNVPDINRRNPVFEFDDGTSIAGPFIFISANTPGSLHADLTDTQNTPHTLISGANLFGPNTWTHIALTYNKADGRIRLYVNGNIVQQQSFGLFTLRTTGNLFLARRAAVGAEESFQGMIDEPAFYSRELTPTEIRSVFLAGNASKCRSRSWLSLSNLGGTLAAGARTNVTLSINTNGNRLAPRNYAETILFTNVNHRRGTTERIATLAVLNRPPTLSAIAPVQILEDSASRTVNLFGIGPGGIEQQQLTVSATSQNPAVIPDLLVNYSSPNTSGSVSFIPAPNAHGTSTISVIVRDDGFIGNGGRNAVTNSFVVTVLPVNDPPTMTGIPNQIVAEGGLLTLTNTAADPDLPGDQLTFTLLTPVAGLSLDSLTGVLTWTPDETQGPSDNIVSVVVQDNASSTATNTFEVTVLEVNTAPMLSQVGDRVVHSGTLVNFPLMATDSDIPANALQFSLGSGSPSGASLDPVSGIFSWTADASAFPPTNTVTVLVTDNGVPILTAMESFKIVIAPAPTIQTVSLAGTNLVIEWTAIPGTRYVVETNSQLEAQGWSDLQGEITASQPTAMKTTEVGPMGRRFYRVRVVP